MTRCNEYTALPFPRRKDSRSTSICWKKQQNATTRRLARTRSCSCSASYHQVHHFYCRTVREYSMRFKQCCENNTGIEVTKRCNHQTCTTLTCGRRQATGSITKTTCSKSKSRMILPNPCHSLMPHRALPKAWNLIRTRVSSH